MREETLRNIDLCVNIVSLSANFLCGLQEPFPNVWIEGPLAAIKECPVKGTNVANID